MPAPTTTSAGPKRVALAASVGAATEWYDFFDYGTAAGPISLTCMWLLPETRGEELRDSAVDEARTEPAREVVAS